MDLAFMNELTDHLIEKYDISRDLLFNVKQLNFAWEQTPAGCTIQRLMVDIMAARMNERSLRMNGRTTRGLCSRSSRGDT